MRLPKMARFRQNFPAFPAVDIPKILGAEFQKIRHQLKPNSTVALGVGSRGIANQTVIVKSFIELLRSAGAQPFIFPAMGSHGGATPEGQAGVLASYGVTEASMGVPIRASMEVRQIGTTVDGAPVYSSVGALEADYIVLINRIKPHTDFFGDFGSGIIKMSVIGLGKKEGAAAMHISASRHGHAKVIREMAGIVIAKTPILAGLAIIENQFHDTAHLELMRREEIDAREMELFKQARALMPSLPFEEIDLLIVDKIGKNISGAGLDPNVVGRGVQGYVSQLTRNGYPAPFIRRIFVRDMTAETHGNAIGIGNADLTTTRLVRAMDKNAMYINALTALTPQSVKIPIYFDTDRECIERGLASLAMPNTAEAKLVRIQDTLNLQTLSASGTMSASSSLTQESPFSELEFDASGNLPDCL